MLSCSLTPPDLCDSSLFHYILTSATTGTETKWSRPIVTGISNSRGSGIDSVNEFLVNITLDPIIVSYFDTLTANGCSNTEKLTLIVNPNPIAQITIKPPSSLCANTMYQNFGTIIPHTGVQYTWSTSNSEVWADGNNKQFCLVNFNSPGIAIVTLTAYIDGFNCNNKDSVVVNVDSFAVSDTPEVVYSNSVFVCQKAFEDSYQWGYDDAITLDSTILAGEINQYYFNSSPDFTMNYYWVITMHNGCMQKSYLNVPPGLSIKNIKDDFFVKIYPNPTNFDYINVEINSYLGEELEIELLDMFGQKIKSLPKINHIGKIDLRGLASGSYLVVCYINGIKISTKKLIKN